MTEDSPADAGDRDPSGSLRHRLALLDHARDALFVLDADGRITYLNRGAVQLYAVQPERARGCDVGLLLGIDTAVQREVHRAVAETGGWHGDMRHRTADGRLLRVAASWSLTRDDHTGSASTLVSVTDLTEQHRLQRHLLQAQRVESLGALVSGMVHDLNNVLAPILLATEVLQDEPTPDTTRELAHNIHLSATRGADLVQQVLSYARGVDDQADPVRMERVLGEIRAILGETVPKNIDLRIQVEPGLGSVRGDSTQLQQVLLNLAVNARDAMPDGGELTIRAHRDVLDDATCLPPGRPGDPVLVIDVRDTGTGMSEEVLAKVFEPFFTTKPDGAGTGLGLSTTRTIVRGHGGSVEVHSELGRGSCVRVRLPASDVDPLPQSLPAAAATIGPRVPGRTILLVDDDGAVRAMTRRALLRLGYRVLEAADGAEAIATFTSHRAEVAAVLVDMMMPTMDGRTTIRALRTIEPDLPVVATSGDTQGTMAAKAASVGVPDFLAKPYSGRQLVTALERALGAVDDHPGIG